MLKQANGKQINGRVLCERLCRNGKKNHLATKGYVDASSGGRESESI